MQTQVFTEEMKSKNVTEKGKLEFTEDLISQVLLAIVSNNNFYLTF